MKQDIWEAGINRVREPVEQCIREVLAEHYSLKISASSLCNKGITSKLLSKGNLAVKFTEKVFGLEVFFSFEGDWYTRLAREVLGIEERGANEITQDLVRDFSLRFIESVRRYLETFDVEPEVSDLELLTHHQINKDLGANRYYTVRLDVIAGEQRENKPKLNLLVALSQPDQQAVDKLLENVRLQSEEMPDSTAGDQEGDPPENEVTEDDHAASLADSAGEKENKRYDLKGRITKKIVQTTMSNDPNEQVTGQKVEFEDFDKDLAAINEDEIRNIDILKDVELDLSVELGRKEILFGEILKLVKGSVIELEKLAGEPVDILVNGFPIAQGEVVVIDEHFGVRVSSLVSRQERLKGIA